MLRGNLEQAAKLWQEGKAIREGLVKGNAEEGITAITAESALVKEFLTARIENYDEAMKVGGAGWLWWLRSVGRGADQVAAGMSEWILWGVWAAC